MSPNTPVRSVDHYRNLIRKHVRTRDEIRPTALGLIDGIVNSAASKSAEDRLTLVRNVLVATAAVDADFVAVES